MMAPRRPSPDWDGGATGESVRMQETPCGPCPARRTRISRCAHWAAWPGLRGRNGTSSMPRYVANRVCEAGCSGCWAHRPR
jgi:hypothetical protein